MKRIAVIGLGTLGGSLCKNISETAESIDELIIVDYDIVERKNIKNSIYKISQIGETKVDALTELIKDEIRVIPLTMKYIEGKTPLPKCDLVIDCRDVVCSRGNEIDVRLYITGKILIIDCRKNVKTTYDYAGSYRHQISKNELNKAGFFATQIICNDQINQMIKNKVIQRVDLNLIPAFINEGIKRSIDNRMDIVYDGVERLHNVEEHITPIMNLNKTSDVEVYIGPKEDEEFQFFNDRPVDNIITFPKKRFALIPKNSLKTSNDLINTLSDVVKKQYNLVNFIVTLKRLKGETIVELLEETGAA